MLRKSFGLFCVGAIVCAGCANKAAMYQKATGLSEEKGRRLALPIMPLRQGRASESADLGMRAKS